MNMNNTTCKFLIKQANITINDTSKQAVEMSCDLFSFFGYIVQIILAVLCFLVLLFKRTQEHPQRPLKIWLFDISKQGASAFVSHFLNLILAVLLSTNNNADQCVWYFINITIDTTIGVFLCYVLIRFIDSKARRYDWRLLQSGLYYEISNVQGKIRTKLNVKMYFSQLVCWVCIVSIVKILLFSFQVIIPGTLEAIGNFLLSPLKNYANVKLVFIMIIIPVILNGSQFWIQDNILKFKGNDEISFEKLCETANSDSFEKQMEDDYIPEKKKDTNMGNDEL